MSCCYECEQSGMGCCQSHSLMGGLLPSLLGGINDPVHAGAPFSLGIEFTGWWEDTSFRDLPDVLTMIESKLTTSGNIQGLVRAYQLAGYFNPFVVVEGYAGKEFANAYALRDAILSVIASEYSGINYGTVRFEVTTYTPGTGQTQQTRQDTPSGAGPPPPPSAPIKIFDDIASALGVTKGTAQALTFGGAALLLILLVKK